MRRVLLVVVLAVTLTVAGCVGGPVSDPTDGGVETDGTVSHDEEGDADTPTRSGPPDGNLTIHHIDAGQADATLLVAPSGETMVIDTGDWRQDGQGVIAYLEAHGVDRIDHLVATHGHADHIGGHAAVIDYYETERDGVGSAYDSGVAHTSRTYERYLDAIENHDVRLFEVQEGDRIPFGDDAVSATVLNPPADRSGSDLHSNSVVLAVQFGDFGYLTTGDAEAGVERRLAAGRDLDADVYQAGHHGSSTSSSGPFLDAVGPEIAVVSSGFESQYGHPHEETLRHFADRGIETYWTGVHGDVVVTTDGTGVSVDAETDAPTEPLELLELKPSDGTDHSVAPALASPRTAALSAQ